MNHPKNYYNRKPSQPKLENRHHSAIAQGDAHVNISLKFM